MDNRVNAEAVGCSAAPLCRKYPSAPFFLIFAGLFALFYPLVYSFIDEASYMAMAYVLKSGHFFIDAASVPVPTWIYTLGRKVFDYPPGMALLLLPFTFIGGGSFYILGAAFHFLGAYYFKKLLRLFKIENSFLVCLYLFFPPFVFYSRTLMSDIPSAALFLAGTFYYFKSASKSWKAGLFWGAALMVRPSDLIYIAPFLAAAVIKALKNPERGTAEGYIVPVSAALFLLGLYQKVLYGSFFLTPYSQQFSVLKNFSLEYFTPNLLHYLKSLMTVYPSMLLAVFFASKTRRPEMLWALALGLGYFSFYYFHDEFDTPLQTAVLGARFLFPAVPFLLLMYAEAVDAALRKVSTGFSRVLAAAIFIALLSVSFFIHVRHQEALWTQSSMIKTIYKTTPDGSAVLYDQSTAKLFQGAWGKRDYTFLRDGEKTLSEFLKTADFEKGVFVVKKMDFSGPLSLAWVSPEEIKSLLTVYDSVLIEQTGALEIYRVNVKK